MHVGAYITCARAHGGRTYGGPRTRRGRGKRGNGWPAVPHAGFVYPLTRPCVISLGSILSTGTQFSRARCSFKFRFPAFARPSYTLDLSFSLFPTLVVFPSLSFALPSFPPFDPRHSFISSLPRHPRIRYSVYFSLVPLR